MTRNSSVITTQVGLIKEVLGKFVFRQAKYALLDFPDHSNVGDSAIWLGETKMLLELTGNQPSYVCKFDNFNQENLNRALPEGPIFVHGGGNFGDVWPQLHAFREMIIELFKDRLIIQLPQSLHFNTTRAIDRCANIIAQHPNFHLLVRDRVSQEFAAKAFQCQIQLVPDMAFCLGAQPRTAAITHDVFMLLREDLERATYDRSPLESVQRSKSADWLSEPKHFPKQAQFINTLNSLLKGTSDPEKKRYALYQQLATGRVYRGLAMLSSGRRGITDRLHAHILSTLLDIPHVTLDNNYGKISRYIESWTHSYPGVKTATSALQAIEQLNELPSE